MLDTSTVVAEFNRLSGFLELGLDAIREQAHAYAEAEAVYRKAVAAQWLEAPSSPNRGEWTDNQRLAWVQGQTADLRRERDIADGMRQAALEAVRSRRAQISAYQSILAAEREEASFARTGPRYEP